MPLNVWRADGRDPDTIRMSNRFGDPPGFNAYVSLTPNQARELIEFVQDARTDFSWTKATTRPTKAYIKQNLKTVDGLAQYIVGVGKNTKSFHVSTGVDHTCGGYSGSFTYNYEMVIPGNMYIVTNGANCNLVPNQMAWDQTKRYVLCNHMQWDQATTIVIRQHLEYTFLTSIPLNWIRQSKKQGGSWTAMNTKGLPYKQKALW